MNDFGRRQDIEGYQNPRRADDAEIIAYAINKGWVMRGFKLGIGFWLAGVFITVMGAVIALAFWSLLAAQFFKAGASSSAEPPPAVYQGTEPPPPPTMRSDGTYY